MITKPEYSPEKTSLLSLAETAELLNIRPDTLRHWSYRNYFPQLKPVKIGGRIFYKYSCINALLK